MKERALRLVSVVKDNVVSIHDVNVAVIVNRHAAQFLYDKVEVNVHADDADEFVIDEKRRDIRDDVKIRNGVDVGFNPSRALAFLRNVVPADILHVVGVILCKINGVAFDKGRKLPFPTRLFALHGKAAFGARYFGRQPQVVGNAAARSQGDKAEIILHARKVFFPISRVAGKSIVAFD